MTINTGNVKQPLIGLSRQELEVWCADPARGLPRYRAIQISQWIGAKRAETIDGMTDLPQTVRQQLAEEFVFWQTEIAKHQIATDRTEKLLLKYPDNHFVETVLMRETKRQTICVSTQVGCAMGCVFCASGLEGVKRNLTTAEILEQFLRIDRRLTSTERLTNVVIMGIGEPLANLKNLLPALEWITSAEGLGLGVRRITVSTVGLPNKMRELAACGKPYNLAVSLHAPNDNLRSKLVPVNKNIGIDAILAAADEYFEKTGRRVTFEYVLLSGINDRIEQAQELARLLKDRCAHVNLIPMNAVEGLTYRDPHPSDAHRFVQILEQAGVPATVRKRKGADIDAACGQLRLQQSQAVSPTRSSATISSTVSLSIPTTDGTK